VRAKEQGTKELSGKDVWRLYDTFGFPVDLTRLMADELGLGVNDKEFDEAQAWSKQASKASLRKDAANLVKFDVHDIAVLEKTESIPKTDDSAKFSKRWFFHLSLHLIKHSRPWKCHRKS
jgi:alanyl-tRNA synthetase